MSIERLHTGKRISRVVIHGDTVYLAGIIPLEKHGQSVTEQTHDVLRIIDRLLGEAGTDKSKLLSATIWLADIRDAEEMNLVWEEWLPDGCAPARATIEGKPTSRDHAVKIAIVAAR